MMRWIATAVGLISCLAPRGAAQSVCVERWEDTEPWRNPDSVQAVAIGGELVSRYDGAGDSQRPISRPFHVPHGIGATAIAQCEITVPDAPPGSNEALYAVFGVSASASPDEFAGIVGGGFSASHRPDYLDGRSASPGRPKIDPYPAGTYVVTLFITDRWISHTVHAHDGTRRAFMRTPHPGGDLASLAIAFRDGRHERGLSIGRVWAARDAGAPPSSSLAAQSVRYIALGRGGRTGQPTPAADRCAVLLPRGHDPKSPTPAILFCHGSSGDAVMWSDSPGTTAALEALCHTYGYALVVPDMAFVSWGNRLSQERTARWWGEVSGQFEVSDLFVLSASMGSTTALNLIHRDALGAPVTAWYGMYPVTNLRAQYDGVHTTAIQKAYGFDADSQYAEATAGNDPNLAPAEAYRGTAMRISYGPRDKVVKPAANALLFQSKLASAGIGISLFIGNGKHADDSQSDTADIHQFFERCGGR